MEFLTAELGEVLLRRRKVAFVSRVEVTEEEIEQ